MGYDYFVPFSVTKISSIYTVKMKVRWTKIMGKSVILHNGDVIMSTMASQITSLTIVHSTVYSAQIKENIKAPRHWPMCGELTGDWWLVNSPHKGPVTGNMFPFDDVIMNPQELLIQPRRNQLHVLLTWRLCRDECKWPGTIPLTGFPSQFEFDGNFVLPSPRF